MAITTLDGLIAALGGNSSRVVVDKASLANAAAGQVFSLWRATGQPGQGAIPAAAALCTSALAGSLPFANQTPPASSYLAWLSLVSSLNPIGIEIYDRLLHMGGLNGTVTTAQTVGLDATTTGGGIPEARRGAANFSELAWFVEVFTDLGSTGVNLTAAVIYDDASTGNLAAIALGATPRAGRLYALVSAVAGRFIRGVNTVTLSATTGAAGNFGVTCMRQRSGIALPLLNFPVVSDWAALGFPEIPNNSCLQFVATCSTTSTGTLRGYAKIAHG